MLFGSAYSGLMPVVYTPLGVLLYKTNPIHQQQTNKISWKLAKYFYGKDF